MGGLLILGGADVSTLLWARLDNVFVWITLLVTVAFGADRICRRLRQGLEGDAKGVSARVRLASASPSPGRRRRRRCGPNPSSWPASWRCRCSRTC
jgi:hypothetical protein